MKDVVTRPIPQFLKSLDEIIEVLLIDEFEFASGRQSMNKAGNTIDHHAKIEFAHTQGFLRTLAVVNIRGNTIPADHATIAISKGLSISAKPPIDVVEPTHTLFNVTLFTCFDGMQPCL